MKLTVFGAVVLGGLAAVPATAQPYDDLFVFGDSLVDSGNARAARLAAGGDDPAPPSAGYFQGRFSNGYNFADYLSFRLGNGPATAAAFGGTNFSVGGAQAAEVLNDASPSFAEQIDLFQASPFSIGADDLVLVTLGGNDVRRAVATGNPNLAPSVAALTAGLQELIGEGARNIVVTGLPDIGQIPAVTLLNNPAAEAAATALSGNLNAAFAAVVGSLAGSTGYNLRFFDLFAFQPQIYADPAAFGLPTPLDTDRSCLVQVPAAAPACTGFVYFDTIHPTTAIHRVIGDAIADQAGVVPEPTTWAMLVLGFGLAGVVLRRRRAGVPALA